jgi:photosystem II stability/assembly factor-like uncharacterized protein
MRPAVVLATLLVTTAASAQWEILPSGSAADLRGIHAIGNGIAWASGTDGTVLRTTDDGKSWQRCATPPAAESLDFRGVQAFDGQNAIVMSSGKGTLSRLYKTTDGCKSWTLLFTNPDSDGFWDALRFRTPTDGYVLGDPVGGQFTIGYPADWKSSQGWSSPGDRYTQSTLVAQEGVHAFAASNSALALSQKDTHPDAKPEMWFGTGGPGGAFIYYYVDAYSAINPDDEIADWHKVAVPLSGSNASSGVFSIAFRADLVGIAVGGDYERPDEAGGTAAFSTDSGKTWEPAQTPPHGFRSAVAYDAATKVWIAVGPNGTDISTDDGSNWRALRTNPALHEPADSDRDWNALSLPFVVGPHGRIGKLRPDALARASAPKGATP